MFLRQIRAAADRFNQIIEEILRRGFFPNTLAIIDVQTAPKEPKIIQDLQRALEESIVWATPKKRTTAEKKLTRKLGEWPTSPIVKYSKVKTNIKTCLTCGSYHELNTICGNCYEKVKEETNEVKKLLNKSEFKYNHPQQEIAFVYENDSKEEIKDTLKSRRLIEVPKKRPTWFNNNLLSKIISNKDKL